MIWEFPIRIPDAQATGEVFGPQKRTSSTKNMKTMAFFLIYAPFLALIFRLA
jgi:hypothetical protein